MASKKTYRIIFIVVAFLIIGAIIIYFVMKDKVAPPTEPVPPGSPSTTWKPESFPLTLGMYGPKIKSLQTWLMKTYGSTILPKYGADGKFGNETKSALLSQNFSVPLSEADYNKIVPKSILG